MKPKFFTFSAARRGRGAWLWHRAVCLALMIAFPVTGAEEPAEATEEAEEPMSAEEMFEGGTETYENWVELSVGGVHVDGNDAQFQERHRLGSDVFGGIEDLHYQHAVGEDLMFSMDGRALFDNHDYSLTLDLGEEEKWFTRFHYENFRTWYNDDGGFYPPSGMRYSSSDDARELDRGEFTFEAGLTLENIPNIDFKYTHRYRDGEKGSTIWGPVRAGGLLGPVKRLYPSFYDIEEEVDIFELNLTHQIKKTGVGLGLRYETGELDNALKEELFHGDAEQRRVTDRQETSYDLLSVHAFTETWIKNNLFLSTGFLFSDMCNDFSGSRIEGNDFDVSYVPGAMFGRGHTNLVGDSRLHEYVANVNLLATPRKDLTIVPSIRVQKEDWGADSVGFETFGSNPSSSFSSDTDGDSLDVRERLDVRYTGVTNWAFYVRGEWTQGEGQLNENGGLGPTAAVERDTDDSRFFQKYLAGAKWYATRRFSLGLEGYYKFNRYEYDHNTDSTTNVGNLYPAFLTMQDFETMDGNVRLTWRPLRSVSLVSLYEFQLSTIDTTASGLSGVESSEMTRHIIGQNVSWTPWSRLYLQAGINYVWSETTTPASAITRAILDAQNNYWTVNANTGFVVDDKTDLNVGYFYYQSDNYENNSATGVPYGAEAREHGVTVGVVRRLTENLRLNVRYGYSHYADNTSGGNNDYEAHLLFSSLQFRF